MRKHKSAIELALCQRDYYLVAEHHPELLEKIESAIVDGISPVQVRRWAAATVGEHSVVQRVYNAARYYKEVMNE